MPLPISTGGPRLVNRQSSTRQAMTLPNDPAYRTMPPGPHSLGGMAERLRHRWGWFVGFGALAAVPRPAAPGVAGPPTPPSAPALAIFIIITRGPGIVLGLRRPT